MDADNTAASNLTKEDQKVFIEEMNKKILEGSLVPSTPEEINRFVSLLKGSQDIWPTKELISFKIPSGDSFGGTLRDWLTKNDYLQYVSPMEIRLKVDLDDVRKSLEKEFPDIAKQAIFLLQKTRVNKGQELVDGAIKARTEFLNTTITERNNHMAQEILKLKGRVLIYVGDAHVPGLKELLTGQGRNVENKRFPVNNAMLILLNHGSKLGGIDLTPANMNFQVKNGSPIKTFGNEAGIKFHLNPAMLAQLRNATGFAPVNITLQPLTNLRGFLGMKQSNSN